MRECRIGFAYLFHGAAGDVIGQEYTGIVSVREEVYKVAGG